MIYTVSPIVNLEGNNGNGIDMHAYGLLEYYYHKMEQQHLLKHAFYDGSATSFLEFKNLALSEGVVFLFIFVTAGIGLPVGHCHLSGMQGYCVTAHFNILREFQFDYVEIMSECARTIFSVTRPDGTVFATSMIGVTPKYNRAARKAIKDIGAKHLAFIEQYCYLYYKNTYDTGELTLLTANDFFNRGV